jgi:hypothetical protein
LIWVSGLHEVEELLAKKLAEQCNMESRAATAHQSAWIPENLLRVAFNKRAAEKIAPDVRYMYSPARALILSRVPEYRRVATWLLCDDG